MKNNTIPVIDLFAGPGGLGEGFSSLPDAFDIKLSIEKDKNAHQTLELRSFSRQFRKGELPEAYYKLLREKSLKKRSETQIDLFNKYPKHAKAAKDEAWLCELGNPEFPSNLIDTRIITHAYSMILFCVWRIPSRNPINSKQYRHSLPFR
jgi:DNA (cytosine-5)-methyltransferase 1